jgi:cell division protease FtsH
MTQDELEDKLTVLLGGRAAEQLVLEKWSTGAADDLAKATEMARHMVARYGMDERLGHATYESERAPLLGGPAGIDERRRVSERTARVIDESVRRIVNAAFDRALALLRVHRVVLEAGAEKLLQRETLERCDLEELQARLVSARNEPEAKTRLAGNGEEPAEPPAQAAAQGSKQSPPPEREPVAADAVGRALRT